MFYFIRILFVNLVEINIIVLIDRVFEFVVGSTRSLVLSHKVLAKDVSQCGRLRGLVAVQDLYIGLVIQKSEMIHLLVCNILSLKHDLGILSCLCIQLHLVLQVLMDQSQHVILEHQTI